MAGGASSAGGKSSVGGTSRNVGLQTLGVQQVAGAANVYPGNWSKPFPDQVAATER
jgi:hypothetical protein